LGSFGLVLEVILNDIPDFSGHSRYNFPILMLVSIGTFQFPKKFTPTGIPLLVTLPAAVHQFIVCFVMV